jgi:hypothetical protein
MEIRAAGVFVADGAEEELLGGEDGRLPCPLDDRGQIRGGCSAGGEDELSLSELFGIDRQHYLA